MPPTKLHQDASTSEGHAPSNGHALGELDERELISRMGVAIADAASAQRRTVDEDAHEAARRAAVDIATATLSAASGETAAHSDDVDIISEAIGRRMGLSGPRLEDVTLAARLHDIGKLAVPPRILNKPATLDRDEWETVRRHTIIGEQILLSVPELRRAARLVRHSHERWDGEGYPDGIGGEQIPLGSRIVFCADAFHAIRSDRPYRKGRTAAEALAEIRACAGTQFDPAVVRMLEEVAANMAASNGRPRARSTRGRRLLALMMIVSVGACGSAIARTGVLPEPKPNHDAGASGLAPGPAGQPPQFAGGPIAAAAIPDASRDRDALRDPLLGLDRRATVTLFGGGWPVPTPVQGLAPGFNPPPTEAEGAVPAEDAADEDSGKSTDNGHGAHGKAKGSGKGLTKALTSSNLGKGKTISGKGRSKASSLGSTVKALKPDKGSHGSSGHGSGGNGGGSDQATSQSSGNSAVGGSTAKLPKPPKPPKPSVTPDLSGATGGLPNGGGASSGSSSGDSGAGA